jgi:hypothetical protein
VTLSDGVLGVIAICSAIVAALSLALTLSMGRRLSRMRRMVRARPKPDPVDPGIASSDWDAVSVAYELAEVREALVHAVQRVGMVRFDAFQDMGGQLSFAAALLDAQGSGMVLSSINGRSETRIYAKPVEQGNSRYNLSDEEQEAIRRALRAVPA